MSSNAFLLQSDSGCCVILAELCSLSYTYRVILSQFYSQLYSLSELYLLSYTLSVILFELCPMNNTLQVIPSEYTLYTQIFSFFF